MIEKIWIWIAWRLPKELVKWAFIRLAVNASASEIYKDTEVPTITLLDALGVWK